MIFHLPYDKICSHFPETTETTSCSSSSSSSVSETSTVGDKLTTSSMHKGSVGTATKCSAKYVKWGVIKTAEDD